MVYRSPCSRYCPKFRGLDAPHVPHRDQPRNKNNHHDNYHWNIASIRFDGICPHLYSHKRKNSVHHPLPLCIWWVDFIHHWWNHRGLFGRSSARLRIPWDLLGSCTLPLRHGWWCNRTSRSNLLLVPKNNW